MLILFDFQGTLVDNAQEMYQAYVDTIKELDFQPHKLEDFLSLMTNDGILLHLLHPDVDKDKFYEEFEKHAAVHKDAKANIVKLFEFLKEKGHDIGILSSLPSKVLQTEIDFLQIREFLTFILGYDDTYAHKPDPRVFDVIFDEGLHAGEIIYVGDALSDQEAAEQAGIEFYGVVSAHNTISDFLDAGVEDDHILYSLLELMTKLM